MRMAGWNSRDSGAAGAETAPHAPPPRRAHLAQLSFVPAGSSPAGDTLVVVFLRGAADGLHMVVPHGEEEYHRLRPSLRLPRPDDLRAPKDRRVIDLDGFFGFHPSLRPLLPAWEAGQLACVQACGAPDESRSHFKAMEVMERGTSQESGPTTGWIGRHLASLDTSSSSPLRAISLGNSVPRSLYGSVPATSLQSITEYHLGTSKTAQLLASALSVLYGSEDILSTRGQETLQILNTLEKLDPAAYRSTGTAYPDNDFGRGLAQIAMLIKAEVGLEIGAIDLGGWDTHFAQGVLDGQMPKLMEELSFGLAAFHSDLADQLGRVCLVVMTEFGRRAYENASLGTDHGHGGMMLVLGGAVNGGRVYTDWPGLEEENLVGPGDLAMTTDYRDVLGEIVAKRLNNPKQEEVFPGYEPRELGLFQEQVSD